MKIFVHSLLIQDCMLRRGVGYCFTNNLQTQRNCILYWEINWLSLCDKAVKEIIFSSQMQSKMKKHCVVESSCICYLGCSDYSTASLWPKVLVLTIKYIFWELTNQKKMWYWNMFIDDKLVTIITIWWGYLKMLLLWLWGFIFVLLHELSDVFSDLMFKKKP